MTCYVTGGRRRACGRHDTNTIYDVGSQSHDVLRHGSEEEDAWEGRDAWEHRDRETWEENKAGHLILEHFFSFSLIYPSVRSLVWFLFLTK